MNDAVRLVLLLGITTAMAAGSASGPGGAIGQTSGTVVIRGRSQALHLYGSRGSGDPIIIVSSGDGGWIHLGPAVAEILAANGFFVVGFDTRAYLEGFTSGSTTLRLEDEPGDYRALADYAAPGGSTKPILIGVSEGAGLSALAATDARTRQAIAGVIALGLPNVTELGWRWKDSLIYFTHQVPNEPTFTSASVVARLSSTPLAIVQAADHRFSGNPAEFERRLLEAIGWVRQHQPG